MKAPRRSQAGNSQASDLARNAVAIALDVFEQIDTEAKRKKLAQIESLKKARDGALKQIEDLKRQIAQLDEAIAIGDGIKLPQSKTTQPKSALPKTPAPAEPARRRPRRKLGNLRKRIIRFLETNKGKKFSAPELLKEFPALKGIQVSGFLKSLRDAGKIQDDISEGIIKTKYYIPVPKA